MLFKFILLLFVRISSSSIISLRGTLTCYGIPYKGTMMMFNNDNSLQGHIFTIRDIGFDGKFHLNGENIDSALDVRLIIEHTCVDWKKGRKLGWGPYMFSEIAVNMGTFKDNNYEMDVGNIELSKLNLKFQLPNLFLRKGLLFWRRILFDSRRRAIELFSG